MFADIGFPIKVSRGIFGEKSSDRRSWPACADVENRTKVGFFQYGQEASQDALAALAERLEAKTAEQSENEGILDSS